jgi:carbon storage regulator
MLILTRKLGEEIRLNDDIVIRVTKLQGNQVALGIEAPNSVSINRQEVYQRLQKQQKPEQQQYCAL